METREVDTFTPRLGRGPSAGGTIGFNACVGTDPAAGMFADRFWDLVHAGSSYEAACDMAAVHVRDTEGWFCGYDYYNIDADHHIMPARTRN